MASFYGHFIAGATIASVFFAAKAPARLTLAAGICACLPDADFIMFKFGVPYSSIWGHRGFTHSAFVTVLVGWLVAFLFFRKSGSFWKTATILALATFSHAILDAMTNGGRGVALWFPWYNERIFLPFRPIQVSPLTLSDFRGDWAATVLWSETVWIALPCLVIYILMRTLAPYLVSTR